MFIMVSVCWTTLNPSLSAPLRRGIGRAWSTRVFCHASQEPRNEWNNSQLLSMLRRAQQQGSTKSFSMAWNSSQAILTIQCPVTGTHICSPHNTQSFSGMWCMHAGTMIPTWCHVKGRCLHCGCRCVTMLQCNLKKQTSTYQHFLISSIVNLTLLFLHFALFACLCPHAVLIVMHQQNKPNSLYVKT